MRSDYLNINNKNNGNLTVFNFCQTPILTEDHIPVYTHTKGYMLPYACVSEFRDICTAILLSTKECSSTNQWILYTKENDLTIAMRCYVCHTENDLYGITIAIGQLVRNKPDSVEIADTSIDLSIEELSTTFVTGGLTKEDLWNIIRSLSLPLEHTVVTSTPIENMEVVVTGLNEEECPVLLGLVASKES